ncbi:unnamed protein product [Leptidea sinapis]|uniref:Uncharacterized protein n=1 Tax=Leptidea sinapis TaxID=189913 RepID=A0A5E4QGT0_9NEOP|nr:unnamed protein product [Leptidea sinapis]
MYVLKENRRKRKKRELWCKHWLLLRKSYSHTSLINELRITPKDFNNYLRMNENTYLHLLSLVTPLIKRQDTILRNAITPHERLTATLRFLATRTSYECLKFSTIISPQALSAIIPETCEAIYKVLHKDYLKKTAKFLYKSRLL